MIQNNKMKTEEIIKLTEKQLEEIHEKIVEIASDEIESESNKSIDLKTVINKIISEQIHNAIREMTEEKEFNTTVEKNEFIQRCVDMNKIEFNKMIKKLNARVN